MLVFLGITGAEGGSRTHTRGEPHRILSPAFFVLPGLIQYVKNINLAYFQAFLAF